MEIGCLVHLMKQEAETGYLISRMMLQESGCCNKQAVLELSFEQKILIGVLYENTVP